MTQGTQATQERGKAKRNAMASPTRCQPHRADACVGRCMVGCTDNACVAGMWSPEPVTVVPASTISSPVNRIAATPTDAAGARDRPYGVG